MSPGGSVTDVGGNDGRPLDYLIRELDLDPPRPTRRRQTNWVAALCIVVSLLLVAGIAGARALERGAEGVEQAASGRSSSSATDVAATNDPWAGYRGPDWIARENQTPGTTDWTIPDDPKMWDKIRGYASSTSVDHGDSFTVFVTTGAPSWKADAYRMGYYQGNGARLVWSSGDQRGTPQRAATVDRKTNMAEAIWDPSLVVETDSSWPPGVYLIRLTSSDGGATFVPMIVRDDGSEAALLVQSSVTTWQAYNAWGGANHYTGAGGLASTRARVISFDRPYGGNGSGEFFGREFEFVYFAERLGLDVTYWTDIDLHERPELAQRHKAVISLGHDEYYSTRMRDGLEQARDHGVNIAFFGANAIYRKIRLEDSSVGSSRRQVNYRSASEDPLTGKQPSEVTVSWRDAPSSRPESSLIGQMYECNPVEADMVIVDAGAWMFEGSELENGDKLPDAIGNEYDRVMPESPTPENIQVVAHSPVTCGGKRSYADATYYTAASGAAVFAVGTFWWIEPLKTECPNGPATHTDCQIQRVVENILRSFAIGPNGERHPSVNNLAKLGIKKGYISKITPPDESRSSPTTRSTTPKRSTTNTTRPPSSTAPPRSSTTVEPSPTATSTPTTAVP
jgi:hypothetical protein